MMTGAWEGQTVTRVSALLATKAGCDRLAIEMNDGLLNCVCFMSPGDVCRNKGVASM